MTDKPPPKDQAPPDPPPPPRPPRPEPDRMRMIELDDRGNRPRANDE
jgi:hypothetical protein